MSAQKIIFAVPPKVHLLDLNGPAHIFYEAQAMGAPLELVFVSTETSKKAQSSAGLYLGELKAFQSVKVGLADLIFIPGMEASLIDNNTSIESNPEFYDWLRDCYAKGAWVCSICTGAFILGEAGLLDGLKCTTHWKKAALFSEKFPNAQLVPNTLFVRAQNIFTSAGVTAGIDMALHIIEILYGPQMSVDIAREVVLYFRRGEADPQLSVFLQNRNHLEDRIHKAQDYIMEHLNSKISIEKLAEFVGMSPRNLTRLFKKTTQLTIGAYADLLRVEKATQLIKEKNKMRYVAQQCGLKSENQLRSLIKKHTGLLPSELQ